MDAKVDDWVVTPRRGKAVEINALWYNALRLFADWLREEGRPMAAAGGRTRHAARANPSTSGSGTQEGGYLYDVVDGEHGDDPALPAQSDVSRFRSTIPSSTRRGGEPCFDVVRERLVTPVGLRSLAPGHPDYKPQYYGDLRARDAAYHQGTVWAWLIGPFIDAYLRVYPGDFAGARVSGGLREPSQRGGGRHDQRNLRRGGAVSRRAAASRRHGALPKCCAPGSRPSRAR